MEKYKGILDGKNVLFNVEYETDADDPTVRWDENAPVIHCAHRRYNLGHKDGADRIKILMQSARSSKKKRDPAGLRAAAVKNGCGIQVDAQEGLWANIYMYEHSGIVVSLNPFSDPFDSGKVGIMYWSRAQRRAYYNTRYSDTPEQHEKDMAVFKSYFEEWAMYVHGEVYQVTVLDIGTGQLIDRLCGIYASSAKEAVAELDIDTRALQPWPTAV
jgi:hypothetical protein